MFQCVTCKKQSKALINDECYDCIYQNLDKEAQLRQHYARYDKGTPLPDGRKFFEWLIVPKTKTQPLDRK